VGLFAAPPAEEGLALKAVPWGAATRAEETGPLSMEAMLLRAPPPSLAELTWMRCSVAGRYTSCVAVMLSCTPNA